MLTNRRLRGLALLKGKCPLFGINFDTFFLLEQQIRILLQSLIKSIRFKALKYLGNYGLTFQSDARRGGGC